MFLATTALTEFWDPDDELLMLGEWCLRYDQRQVWKHRRYQVLPSPWNDRARFYAAATATNQFYEYLLPPLASLLNELHHTAHPLRYWRILIGPWVNHHIQVAYDRYVHLLEAFKRQPSLTTLVLHPSSYRTPCDMRQYIDWLPEDCYNLQLYSRQLSAMGHNFPSKPLTPWPLIPKRFAADPPLHPMRHAGFSLLERALQAIGRTRQHVALYALYANKRQLWTMAVHSRLAGLPYDLTSPWTFDRTLFTPDPRREWLRHLPTRSEFERLCVHTLAEELPPLYLEHYAQASDAMAPLPPRARVIASAIGWTDEEPFKFLAAQASSSCRLLAVQHGAGYGMLRAFPYEQHEAALSDFYIGWGWAQVNLPSLRLSMQKTRSRPESSRGVLLVTTNQPRYLIRFQSNPVGSQWTDYMAWHARFLAALPPGVLSTVRLRAYPEDNGHGMQARLVAQFPLLSLDDHPGVVSPRLASATVIVLDHPGTTWLECLAYNLPVVAFWNPQHWEMRPEAEAAIELLRACDMLWHSPEAAAEQVRRVCDDPRPWWHSRPVQHARRLVADRYALTSSQWRHEWSQMVRTMRSGDGVGYSASSSSS